MINFDREYIPKLADLSKPLYNAFCTDGKKLEWNVDLQTLFDQIKALWSTELMLIIPDPNKKFTMETDASATGLGCTLRQEGKPIFHISRVLKKSEKNLSITQRELLAIVWGLEKLQYYLLGKKFDVITDHKALEELMTKRVFGNGK